MTATAPVLGQGLPPEARHPAATAIHRLQRAFVKDDYDGVCAGLTRAAARQAGEAGHGDPTACRRDVRRMLGMIRDGGGWRHAGEPRVIGVEADGPRAIATVALDRRWRAEVPLTRTAGRWRLSGFLGTPPARARQIARSVLGTGFPASDREPVEVSNGERCPDLDDGSYPSLRGGCVVSVSGSVTPLTILTALGDFKFDDCSIEYRVRVDSAGRTWTEEFQVEGGPDSVACGDVGSCYDFAHDTPMPWRGRMYPDGDDSFVHRMDMCLQTCVGAFVGDLNVRLSRDGDGWRAEPVDGGGSSGFRFDGPLRVKGALDVEAADG